MELEGYNATDLIYVYILECLLSEVFPPQILCIVDAGTKHLSSFAGTDSESTSAYEFVAHPSVSTSNLWLDMRT